MSPQPFPNIFSGLAQGIETGSKVGLMMGEMKLRKEEMAQKSAEEKRKNLTSQLSTGLELAANKNVPKSIKLESLNNALSAYNTLYGNKDGTGIPPMTEWVDELGDVAKEAIAILNDPKIPTADKPRMFLGLVKDAESIPVLQPFIAHAKAAAEETIKGQQAEIKRQAIPILIKFKKGGFSSLTEEEKDLFTDWSLNPHAQVAVGEAADQIDKEMPVYMKYPKEAAGWEEKKAGIQAVKEKGVAEFKKGLKKEEPTKPMTQANASTNLSNRFGNMDEMGRFYITEELQGAHSRAQEKLAELLQQGVDPLTAVNQAETYGRKKDVSETTQYTIGGMYQGKKIADIGRVNGAITQLKLENGTIVQVK